MDGELYNTAAALNKGKILGFTTKTFLPNYGEFYEMRQFTPGPEEVRMIRFAGEEIPFGPQILFESMETEGLILSAEICEDVWSPVPPSIKAALEGAVILVNCSASDENNRKEPLPRGIDQRTVSQTDCGICLRQRRGRRVHHGCCVRRTQSDCGKRDDTESFRRFANETIYSEIDIKRLLSERRKNTTFRSAAKKTLPVVPFSVKEEETALTRTFSPGTIRSTG